MPSSVLRIRALLKAASWMGSHMTRPTGDWSEPTLPKDLAWYLTTSILRSTRLPLQWARQVARQSREPPVLCPPSGDRQSDLDIGDRGREGATGVSEGNRAADSRPHRLLVNTARLSLSSRSRPPAPAVAEGERTMDCLGGPRRNACSLPAGSF
jgi:hypothetical protein